MSVRLPIVPARPAVPRPAAIAAGPRAVVSRPLVCIAAAGENAEASLRFARALIGELARRGRAATVLVARNGAFASQSMPDGLRAAGARAVIAVASAELPDSALAALDALAPDALAVGIGAELAAQLGALLTVRVGRDAASAGGIAPALRGGAMSMATATVDLEVHAEAEAVASEIGAWLAQHRSARNR